jgi:hypothetical protein
MKRLIACLAALALLFASAATACPPVDPDGGGSFSSFGAGYGTDACEAPMAVAGNFAGYGGAMVAAPSYGVQSFVAPSYANYGNFGTGAGYGGGFAFGGHGARFAAPVYTRSQFRARFAAPVVYPRTLAAPVYGAAVVTAPVVHTRAFVHTRALAAPAYGVTVAAPVVAVPVRAPGPIRGAVQGFFGGVRNRLNGF